MPAYPKENRKVASINSVVCIVIVTRYCEVVNVEVCDMMECI